MKKLLVTILLAACLAASAGCGSTSSNNVSSKTFEVDTDKYKDDGYIAISDIAYAKITATDDVPMITIVYIKNDPDEAVYAMGEFSTNSILKGADYTLIWDGETCVIDQSEVPSDITEEEFNKYFPKGLQDALRSGEHLNLPDETKKVISGGCDAVIKAYKDSLTGDNNSSSTELKRDTVSFSGGKMLMVLSQADSGQKEFYVSVDAIDDWSAYISYFIISMMQNDDYKFTIISSFDSTVITSSGLTMFKDGSMKFTSDYITECIEKYADVPEDKTSTITGEITENIFNFLYK